MKCMTNYMAGTSFATPLAAALIANVFSYYCEHQSRVFHNYLDRTTYKSKCFTGVRKVLTKMSEEVGEFMVISPWKKSNHFANYVDDDGDLNVSLKGALKS